MSNDIIISSLMSDALGGMVLHQRPSSGCPVHSPCLHSSRETSICRSRVCSVRREERGECPHGHLVTEEVAPVAGGNHHWLAESGLGPGCSVCWVWPGEGLVTVELCLVSCLLVRVVLQAQAATPPAPSSPLVRGAQLPRHLGLSWGEH